jgi:hypothetical protein
MSRRPARPGLAVPLALSAGLALARAMAAAPLADPLGAPLPPDIHLTLPGVYLAAAPLFTLWDGVSMLSLRRLEGFLYGLALLYVVWRVLRAVRQRRVGILAELGALAVGVALLAAFVAGGLLWHRPMASLAGTPADAAAVDFHSHTRASHDVGGTLMDRYGAGANLAWHRRAGFDAVFITDHNTVTRAPGEPASPAACPGIEISAWKAHILLLGDTLPVDRTRYNRDLTSLLDLLGSSEAAYGALSVASIPEYVRNHWSRLDTLVAGGLDGFEIVNASPKANELTRSQRDTVVALARRTGSFLVGVSDHHGWGATSMVWNLVSVPGWRAEPDRLCAGVLARLGSGFGAVRILERHRLRPDSAWPVPLTPLGVVWETWRGMGHAAAIGWLVWVWGIWGIRALRARERGVSP